MALDFSDAQWAKWREQYDRARNEFLEEWYPTLVRYAVGRWSYHGGTLDMVHEAVLAFIEQGWDPAVQSPEDALWTYMHRAWYRHSMRGKRRRRKMLSLGEAERRRPQHPFPQVEARIDAEKLLTLATPRQRELIMALLYGYTVREICAEQGVRRNGVTRAISCGLDRMARRGGICTNTNESSDSGSRKPGGRRPTLSVKTPPKRGAP